MARTGRPRTKIDRQELYGAFARMPAKDREQVLEVMTAVHEALSPVTDSEEKKPTEDESAEGFLRA